MTTSVPPQPGERARRFAEIMREQKRPGDGTVDKALRAVGANGDGPPDSGSVHPAERMQPPRAAAAYEVTWTDDKPPKLVLPDVPEPDDLAAWRLGSPAFCASTTRTP